MAPRVQTPALVQVLTEPKNSLVKQYQKLFELDNVELVVEPEALDAIANLALERFTGARGLRSIMETVLQHAMYEIPSREDIEKVVITRACVEQDEQPLMVTRGKQRREKSA